MSLSPPPSKLVPLIDQSLYERGYLISNGQGSEGGMDRECKCAGTGRAGGGGQNQGRAERKREEENEGRD